MEDSEIVELCFARDQRALAGAEERHGAYLRAVAGNILGTAEDAEECVQDAFLRAWNAIPPDRPRDLRAYLAKITRNLAFDRYRRDRAARRGGGETALVLEELEQVTGGAPDVFQQVSAKELGSYVNRYIHSLPTRQGDIMVRRYFYGEDLASIARRYGMTKNAVSVALLRVRRGLERYLREEGLL